MMKLFIIAIKIYITFLIIYTMTKNNVLHYWFKFNSLKANPDKFQLMILGANKNKSFSINIRGINILSKNEVILLGATIDHELKLNKHIEDLCTRASFKLHTFRRIRKYLGITKARILANTFIESQFNYAPLMWMFASKMTINKICKLHYRTLKVVYNEYDKSYEELLEMSKSASIHQRHLQFLVLEVYKSLMHLNPGFMWSYFSEKPLPYNLRNGNSLQLPHVKSYRFGINSLRFRGSLLRNNFPFSVKNTETLTEFKNKLNILGNIHCTCVLCR